MKNNDYYQILQQLRGSDPTISPKKVVDFARPEDSPLHDKFEWDDTKAAEAHRLWQARQFIVSVRIIGADKEEEEQVFYNIKISEEEQGYSPLSYILSHEDLADQLVAQAKKELHYWMDKYNSLKEKRKEILKKALEEIE